MSSAGGDGGDGGEEETRKIEARKIKDAERSRKRRADKKAKDEAETKKMKAMEVRMAEMEKSLESKDVKIAATEAGYQSLLAENQRLLAENSALKKNADLIIWDEVGDDQFEREKVLLDLEQECLEVYRRKVDSVNISRARRHPELAESEAEFTSVSIPGWVMLHHLGIVLTILWSLMDSRYEDWPLFSHSSSLLSFHQPRGD